MPYKNPKDRKYDRAAQYESDPQQVANRVARNKARREAMRAGKVTKGDGKDLAHREALDKAPGNNKGTFVQDAGANRSFKRDSKHNLVSEVSKRERKKK